MLFSGSSALFAQNSDVKINGVVIDELGEAMIGVTVVAEGSTVGTVTDFDGAFSLNVPGSTKNIIVSFVGYHSQTVAVRQGAAMRITLVPPTLALDDVLVIGTGTTELGRA